MTMKKLKSAVVVFTFRSDFTADINGGIENDSIETKEHLFAVLRDWMVDDILRLGYNGLCEHSTIEIEEE